MNDTQRLELAEKMVGLTEEGQVDFLSTLADTPSAEDLASVQKLVEDLKATVADPVCDAPEEPAPVIA